MTPLGPSRRPKGTGSIIRMPAGWRASLELPGVDGKRKRWTVQRKTQWEVAALLDAKLAEVAAGKVGEVCECCGRVLGVP